MTVSVFAACAALIATAGNFTIAERGKPADCAIVVPAKATPVQRYAAEELQKWTERLTGVKLPLAERGDHLPKRAVVIEDGGAANPSEDGFRLTCDGTALRVIAAAGRGGPLYGVYELLERFGGCRWYSSWCDRIPKIGRFAVPADLDETQVPAFAMRQPWWFDPLQHHDFAARLRMNTHQWGRMEEKYGGERFRFGGGLGSCHTFETLVPIAKYGKEHPEYFAFRDGKRRNVPAGNIQYYAQLCLTNPDVLKIVVEGVKERIRKDPGARFYGVSQNDNWHYCMCEKCAAVDAEEESNAGTVVRFVNAVAEEIEKEFPDVTIETLAYMFSRKPPKKTRLRHNVIPCLCSIECDFARPFVTSPFKENIAFRKDIEGWKRQTDMLYVWDYTTDFAHYPLPFANVYSLQDNIRFFRDNGVKCLFEQGAYQGRHGDFAELKAWLESKWMWNPELPAKALLDDFFDGYYRKGAPFVREYFEELHRVQSAYSAAPDKPLTIFLGPELPSLTDDFLEKAVGLFARAAKATKDDPVASYNVRMAAFSVDYVRMMRSGEIPLLVLDPGWAKSRKTKRQKELATSLLARMDEAKDICLCEDWAAHGYRHQSWRDIVEGKLRVATGGRAVLEESVLKLARPGEWGRFVDDPQAEDGKALQLYNNNYEWNTTLPMGSIVFEPDVAYTLRVRAKVEPKAGAVGMAFWSSAYDPVNKRGCGTECHPKVTEVKPGYQWYDVLTWVPKPTDYFWFGPGHFRKDKGESTSIENVWIDKIEFVRKGK